LAVLKTGAAYLPLDPHYPQERLTLMAQHAGAQMILSQQDLAGRVPQSCRALWLDAADTMTAVQAMPAANPGDHDRTQPLRPHNIAYVIYTSGSSGTPKGVALTHANMANLVGWASRRFSRGGRSFAASTSTNFDV